MGKCTELSRAVIRGATALSRQWLAETALSGQGGTLVRQEACRATTIGATGLLSRQCPAETCHSAQMETVARHIAFVAPVLTARQVDFVAPG